MAVNFNETESRKRIVIDGIIGMENIDGLLALLRDHPEAEIDLAACEHLHTAALQLLLMAENSVIALPESTFWCHFFNLKEQNHENDPACR
jgi:hypothetical protein